MPELEEPALVRFQAVKELTEPQDEVIIDYTPVGDRNIPGERRALAVIVRKDILAIWKNICLAAGLKLEGVTPRPFGAAATLRKIAGTTALTPLPNPPDSASAVAIIGESWAEFLVMRGDMMLLARTVAVGPGLAGEIRRNLAVYSGQAGQQPVSALYLAGNITPDLRERLTDMLPDLKLHPLDPFGGVDLPEIAPISRGSFAGAVGLLYAKSEKSGLPINFIQPREPKPPVSNRRQLVLGGVLAFVIIFGGGGLFCYQTNAAIQTDISSREADQKDIETKIAKIREEHKHLRAIEEWETADVVDEFYDLTARFPDGDALRVKHITFEPLKTNPLLNFDKQAKGKQATAASYASKMVITFSFENPTTALKALNELLEQFKKDHRFYSVEPAKANNASNEYIVTVYVDRRSPKEWERVLKAPPPAPAKKSKEKAS